MGQTNSSEPASPLLAAFLAFDSTTGALAPGSWGATLVVNVADQDFTATPMFGVTGPPPAGDVFGDAHFATVAGAGARLWIQLASSDFRLQITDAAGALALLPANTRINLSIYRRNGAIG